MTLRAVGGLFRILRCAGLLAGLVSAAAADTRYGDLPLAFEPAGGGRYVARAAGLTVTLAPDKAVLSRASPRTLPAIRIRFEGALSEAALEGESPLPGSSHYFIGRDPAGWRTGVPHFARVRSRGLYPGVDAVFLGDQDRLRYDLELRAGADPSAIRIAFEGARRLRVNARGDLVMDTAAGKLVQQRPRVWQEREGTRREIAADYVLLGRNRAGIRLGPYDRAASLLIDPVVAFSTYLGGSGSDGARRVIVDAAGNAYIVGQTSSTNFPTAGAARPANAGGTDVFVAKVNPQGTALLFSTYLGGSSLDQGEGLALDAAGNIYVVGTTQSTNFPVTTGVVQSTRRGTQDAFVAKLSPTGATLLYATYLGGTGTDSGFGIAVDPLGNAFVTGEASTSFPTTMGAFRTAFGGSQDAFVAKLNPAGASLVYSTFLGGSAADRGYAIAVDAGGAAYVTGQTASSNFPTASPFQAMKGGASTDTDAFVTKLDPAGSMVAHSSYLGGSAAETGYGIAVDTAGNAYVAGQTASNNFPSTQAVVQPATAGGTDAFITKVSPTGFPLVYSSYLGGSGFDAARGIVVDASGSAHVTGETQSANFPMSNPLQPVPGGGSCGTAACRDAFLARLTPAGDALTFATFFGGRGHDWGYGIAVDGGGNVFVAGQTESTSLFATGGSMRTSSAGGSDAFLARIQSPAAGAGVAAHLSAGSFTGLALAPESIATAFGAGFATETQVATATPLPTSLAGASVLVRDSAGVERLAPLFFVSPAQINYLLPAGTAPGEATITIRSGDGGAFTNSVRVDPAAPSFFSANASGQGVAAAQAVRVRADGSQSVEDAFQFDPVSNRHVATPILLGPETDQVVLVLFATGLRGRSSLEAVSVTIAGIACEVLYAGPQGQFVGLDQMNVRLPRSLLGRETVEVLARVDEKWINAVTVFIGGRPRLTSLSPNIARSGLTIANFTINGENLDAASAIVFSPATGITVTNLTRTPAQLTAQLTIASTAAIGSRNVSVSTPGVSSNTLSFTIQPDPSSPTPFIFNVTVNPPGATGGGNALVTGRFEFNDGDGDIRYTGATAGSARIRFRASLGLSTCTIEGTGAFLDKAGQTSGVVDFSLTYRGSTLTIGIFTVSVVLIDAAGNVSNTVNFSPGLWICWNGVGSRHGPDPDRTMELLDPRRRRNWEGLEG